MGPTPSRAHCTGAPPYLLTTTGVMTCAPEHQREDLCQLFCQRALGLTADKTVADGDPQRGACNRRRSATGAPLTRPWAGR